MIEFQNLSFAYPDSADGGLKNIDLTIPDGQCVLLCGRSGCGKTTLTRLINGLIPQFFAGELSGRVLLDGENIFSLPMYRIAERVGSVFQNPRTQFFNVDTDSEIAFGMENGAVPQAEMKLRVAETAKALYIEPLLGRNIFALSGGEKQKIAFASVYAMEPEIYLLDEPSSNLDMTAIGELREHLKLIKAQGKTVVVAAFQILPFFVMAQVIGRLLAGNKDLAAYLVDCAVMAAFWLLRVLFHSLSTAQSHKATFAVLGNIRKQGLSKLARMPLGDVQARGSGELKNILVERVDSIEPTLAHVIPEMSSNAAVVLATLIYLFALDWRMALASLITFPLGMVFFMLMMVGYDKNYARTVAATNALNDTAVEYIGGIEVIKVFGKAKSSYEKFVSAAKECARSYIDWMNKSNFYFTFAMNTMPATLLTVLPIGGLLLKNGTLTPMK